jgi:5-formyltetrahydrofolate cyclo-ligase
VKQELRKESLTRRSALSAQERRVKSAAVEKMIRGLEVYRLAQTVMLYLDFRGEVETTELVLAALAEYKRVIIPVCNKDKTITPVEIKDLDTDLQIGTWGIREAKTDRCTPINPMEIDLVLVPGVAFDAKGNRLGYGAGYYDRFIPSLRPGIPLVALAYETQLVPDAKPEPHDRPMDMVVTEDRIIYCK